MPSDSKYQQAAFFPPAPKSVAFGTWVLRGSIVVALAFMIYSSLTGRIFQPLFEDARQSRWAAVIVRPSMLWATMGMVLLSFRTLLWFRYRPFRPADPPEAPFLTVIIPAYNEGPMVRNSISSVAAAHYPPDRLEIIVVDDGSRDDTWTYIQAAAERHPHLVTTVRFEKNRGKRAALEAGFRRAKGEIFVTIDSDSVIDPHTLLAIAGPFRNPSVGAVAGKVSVYNRNQGIIPRMLHVRFTLSFDFLRAAQSTYGTVYCCPGALSAYRGSVVREVLDAWLNQTFLGEACTYGEDRSMTNFVLSRGYDTVYQRTAVVRTNVPRTYSRLSKMYLRWDRSYIKEEIRFSRIVWNRPPVPRVIAFFDFLFTNLRYPIHYMVLALLVLMVFDHPFTIVRLLFSIGVISFLHVLYYLQSERSWDFVYGIFYAYFSFFTLFWVFPAAAVTVRSRSWMTR